jgi:hypothetical protein
MATIPLWQKESVEAMAENLFPKLRNNDFQVIGAPDWKYNCAAFGFGLTDRWLWPTDNWPRKFNKADDLRSFTDFLVKVGNAVETTNEAYERGFIKIALYGGYRKAKHVARQRSDGLFISKCGSDGKIAHKLHDLEEGYYGDLVGLYKVNRSNFLAMQRELRNETSPYAS